MRKCVLRATIAALCICLALPVLADIEPLGWVDYSGSEYVTPWGNNQAAVALPFTFDFYGGARSTEQVILQANGYLGFGPFLINSETAPAWPYYTYQENYSRVASALWHDFHFTGRVYHQTVGSGTDRRFVVTWDTFADAAETESNIFQIQLHEATGTISYHYHTVTGVDGARVGVNYGDGVEYTGFWYDGGSNFDGGGLYNANQQGPTGNLEGWTISYDFNPETGSYDAQAQYVPEPGTLALLLIGIAGGAVRLRRHRST